MSSDTQAKNKVMSSDTQARDKVKLDGSSKKLRDSLLKVVVPNRVEQTLESYEVRAAVTEKQTAAADRAREAEDEAV